jgi:hypothetical protein
MPDPNPAEDIAGEFNGLLLTSPLRYREMEALRLIEGIEREQTSTGQTQAIQFFDQAGALLARLKDLYSVEHTKSSTEYERFAHEPHTYGISRGAKVVFMGYDPSVHSGSLNLLVASFREDGLVLGKEYQVVESRQMRAGYSFAIRGPDGERLYLDYTYFGLARG